MPNKRTRDCRNYERNISETFQETVAQERKVNNASGVNLRRNVAFARTPSFSPE